MSAIMATIRIVYEEIDPDTAAEIAESAESHDTDGGLERWLGDKLQDAEDTLNEALPEGWKAKVYEVVSEP